MRMTMLRRILEERRRNQRSKKTSPQRKTLPLCSSSARWIRLGFAGRQAARTIPVGCDQENGGVYPQCKHQEERIGSWNC
mmetsp:Transcript_65561/g.103819  ORF Transcript_65561/g.103819 Transcript_65561/m.103819 type:complete len:80 (+) Transcript_65561:111-350(+)